MVCDQRIAGLLAQIHRPVNPKFCESTGMTFSTYTNISEYSDWIRNEAALYNNTGNSWTNWTNSVNSKPSKGGSLSQTTPVILIALGLIFAVAMQVFVVYSFAMSV